MPSYAWLLERPFEDDDIQAKLRAMVKLGVPYREATIDNAAELVQEQARSIAAELAGSGVTGMENKEITALIAYLQRLGTDIKAEVN